MKKYIIIIAIFFSAITATGQSYQYDRTINTAVTRQLTLVNLSGEVTLKGTSTNHIRIRYESRGHANFPSKDGVYERGTDNTGVGILLSEKKDQMFLTGVLSPAPNTSYTIEIPHGVAVSIESSAEYTQNIFVEKLNSDIDVHTSHSISVLSATGAIVIQTTGKGEVRIGEDAKRKKPISIITETGNVMLNLAKDTDANINMGSASGTIYYTNEDKKGKVTVEAKYYKIGKGGVDIHVQTLSGNVYLKRL